MDSANPDTSATKCLAAKSKCLTDDAWKKPVSVAAAEENFEAFIEHKKSLQQVLLVPAPVFVEDPGVITQILKHLSERDAHQSRPPARGPPGLFD